MDRRRCVILLLLLFLLGAQPQQQHRALMKKRGAAAPTPIYLLQENFEGTGYQNAGLWTESGDPDEDSTTVALSGTQSFRTDASEFATIAIASNSDVYFSYTFRAITTATAANIHFRLRTGGTDRFHIQLLTTNLLRVTHGSTIVTGATVLTDDTTYYVWGRYKTGTGADGVAELYVSSTPVKPGTMEVGTTTANGTSAVNTVFIGASSATDAFVLDDIAVWKY